MIAILATIAVALAFWLGHRVGWRRGREDGFMLGHHVAVRTLREAAKRWERPQ